MGWLRILPFERGLHGLAGRVRGMDHPAVAVPALGRQVVAGGAGRVPGEGDPLADQPLHGFPAALDDVAGNRLVAQARARHQGVADMGFQGVVAGQDGGYPPLRPAAGAVQKLPLGDQADLLAVGDVQGQGQAGQPGSDHQDVEFHCCRGCLPDAPGGMAHISRPNDPPRPV